MIKKILVFLSILALAGTVYAENRPWTEEEKYWGIAAGVLLSADWLTTRNMTKRYGEGYYERNPLLGSHPSTARVNQHFAIGIPLTFIIADYLDKDRKTWLMGVTVIEAIAVGNNLRIGLRIQY